MSYYAAALAGVDILDTAFSAFAWGTSQPPTESMVAALRDTPMIRPVWTCRKLYEIGEHFAAFSEKYRPLLTPEATRPNVNVLLASDTGRHVLQSGQPAQGAKCSG